MSLPPGGMRPRALDSDESNASQNSTILLSDKLQDIRAKVIAKLVMDSQSFQGRQSILAGLATSLHEMCKLFYEAGLMPKNVSADSIHITSWIKLLQAERLWDKDTMGEWYEYAKSVYNLAPAKQELVSPEYREYFSLQQKSKFRTFEDLLECNDKDTQPSGDFPPSAPIQEPREAASIKHESTPYPDTDTVAKLSSQGQPIAPLVEDHQVERAPTAPIGAQQTVLESRQSRPRLVFGTQRDERAEGKNLSPSDNNPLPLPTATPGEEWRVGNKRKIAKADQNAPFTKRLKADKGKGVDEYVPPYTMSADERQNIWDFLEGFKNFPTTAPFVVTLSQRRLDRWFKGPGESIWNLTRNSKEWPQNVTVVWDHLPSFHETVHKRLATLKLTVTLRNATTPRSEKNIRELAGAYLDIRSWLNQLSGTDHPRLQEFPQFLAESGNYWTRFDLATTATAILTTGYSVDDDAKFLDKEVELMLAKARQPGITEKVQACVADQDLSPKLIKGVTEIFNNEVQKQGAIAEIVARDIQSLWIVHGKKTNPGEERMLRNAAYKWYWDVVLELETLKST